MQKRIKILKSDEVKYQKKLLEEEKKILKYLTENLLKK